MVKLCEVWYSTEMPSKTTRNPVRLNICVALISLMLNGYLCEEATLMTKLMFNVEIAADVYSEAERKCGEASGHLLDLRSPYLFSALNQLQPFYNQGQLKPSNFFSTGLRRTEPGAETFTWYDGQLDTDSFNRTYYYYLPEDDAQDCVSLKWSKSSKQWVLKITDCNVAYPWICQIQTSEHCSYCPHPDTKLTSTTISENSEFLAPSACQDTCTNAASMPEPEMHCWFYAYNAETSVCVTFRDPELVDTVKSDSWQQTDPDWVMYEKQCISVRIVRNGVVEDQSDNCSLPPVEIIPKTTTAMKITTWIAAETTNLLQVTTSSIMTESTVATSSWSESEVSDTTTRRREQTSSPATMTSDMLSHFTSAANTLWFQPTSSLFGDITIRRDIFSTVVSSTSDLSAIFLPSEFLQVTTVHWLPLSFSSDFSETPGPGNTVEFRSASTLDPSKNDFSAALVTSSSDFSSAISSKSDFPTTLIPSKVDDFTTELMPGTFSSDFIETPAILSDISGDSSSAAVLDSLKYDISVSFQLSSSYGFGGSWIRDSLGLEVSAKLTSSNFEEFGTTWMLSTTFSATPALGSDEFNSAPSSFSLHVEMLETTISRSSVVFDAIGSSLTSGTVRTDIPSPSTAEGTRLHLNSVGSTTGVSLIAVPLTSHTLCDGGPQITPTYLAELTTTPTLQTRSVFPVFSVPINCSAKCPCLRKYTDIREDLLRNITIDFQNLSSYKRLYYSAEDDRISVKVLGYTGVTCMVCFVLFVLLLDSSALWKVEDLVQIRRN